MRLRLSWLLLGSLSLVVPSFIGAGCIDTGGDDGGDDGGDACTKEYAPVCGADGNTYGNRCTAEHAGIEVLHDGACDTRRRCTTNEDCGSGERCVTVDGDTGGGADVLPAGESRAEFVARPETYGYCEPEICACTADYHPVCGVDGVTYGNACEAGCAHVAIAHEGECVSETCHSNEDCADGEQCVLSSPRCGVPLPADADGASAVAPCFVEPIGRCEPIRVCPAVLCDIACEHFAKDADGCDTCGCAATR